MTPGAPDSGWGNFEFRGAGITSLKHAINLTVDPNDGTAEGDSNTILNSPHPGGIHVLLLDGSSRFVSDDINFVTLKRLCSRNDGEVITDGF